MMNARLDMRYRNALKRAMASFTLAAFVCTAIPADLTWAAEHPTEFTGVYSNGAGGPGFIKDLYPGTFTLPAHLGTIRDSWSANAGTGRPDDTVVVHIQDAHCHYDAQHKVAEIVDYLRREYGVECVNLEGGAGEYDLSLFTAIADAKTRNDVSDYFVKEGLVSGVEQYAINNPGNVRLWGIEDRALYVGNLDAYRSGLDDRARAEAGLKSLSVALNTLKPRVYSKELFDFDLAYNRYKAGNLDFKDYVGILAGKALDRSIDISKHVNIALLLRSSEAEKGIDFKRADTERSRLIDALQKTLSRYEVGELAERAALLGTGRLSRREFYGHLFTKAAVAGIDHSTFAELGAYAAYVGMYESVDKLGVFEEIGSLEEEIRRALSSTDGERRLSLLSKDLAILRNIFSISATRDDYNYYLANKGSFAVDNYKAFIKAAALAYKVDIKIDGDIAPMDRYRAGLEKFYEYSLKRDEAFVRNLRYGPSVGRSPGPPVGRLTVMVTGGFHSDNLAALFRRNGVSYVSILPGFKDALAQPNPYFRLLAGKPAGVASNIRSLCGFNLAIASLLTELGRDVHGPGNELFLRVYARWAEARRAGKGVRIGRRGVDAGGNIVTVGAGDEGAFEEVVVAAGTRPAANAVTIGAAEAAGDGVTRKSVTVEGADTLAGGEAYVMDPAKVEVRQYWDEEVRGRDFIDNPVNENSLGGLGKTLKDNIDGAADRDEVMLAFNSSHGNFWEPSQALIVDGRLVAKSPGARGVFQQEYAPLNGRYWVVSFDPENRGVFEVNITNGELPQGFGVRNGILGSPLIINGRRKIDEIKFDHKPALQGDQILWKRDLRMAMSAIGYDVAGNLVRVAFWGSPDPNAAKKEGTIDDLVAALERLGVKDAVLLGTSADVQTYDRSKAQRFSHASGRLGSFSGRLFPDGKFLGTHIRVYPRAASRASFADAAVMIRREAAAVEAALSSNDLPALTSATGRLNRLAAQYRIEPEFLRHLNVVVDIAEIRREEGRLDDEMQDQLRSSMENLRASLSSVGRDMRGALSGYRAGRVRRLLDANGAAIRAIFGIQFPEDPFKYELAMVALGIKPAFWSYPDRAHAAQFRDLLVMEGVASARIGGHLIVYNIEAVKELIATDDEYAARIGPDVPGNDAEWARAISNVLEAEFGAAAEGAGAGRLLGSPGVGHGPVIAEFGVRRPDGTEGLCHLIKVDTYEHAADRAGEMLSALPLINEAAGLDAGNRYFAKINEDGTGRELGRFDSDGAGRMRALVDTAARGRPACPGGSLRQSGRPEAAVRCDEFTGDRFRAAVIERLRAGGFQFGAIGGVGDNIYRRKTDLPVEMWVRWDDRWPQGSYERVMRVGHLFFMAEEEHEFLARHFHPADPALRDLFNTNVIILPSREGTEDGPTIGFRYGDWTILAIIAMIEEGMEGRRAIDMGAGTGALSLAALKLGAEFADLVDLDAGELETARAAMALNGFAGSADFRVHRRDLLGLKKSDFLPGGDLFGEAPAAIISNIGMWPDDYNVSNADTIGLIDRVAPNVTLYIGSGYLDKEVDGPKLANRDMRLIKRKGFSVRDDMVVTIETGDDEMLSAWWAVRDGGVKPAGPRVNRAAVPSGTLPAVPSGAIHSKETTAEDIASIASAIDAGHKELDAAQKDVVRNRLEELFDLAERISNEAVRARVQQKMLDLVGALDKGGIVAYDPSKGIRSPTKYVLACILPSGKIALIDGFFKELNRPEYQQEILLHEILALTHPEISHTDHKARYASPSTLPGGFSSELAGIQREVFGEANPLKEAVRGYVVLVNLSLLSRWPMDYGLQGGSLSKRAAPIYEILSDLLTAGGIDPDDAERVAQTLARMKDGSIEILYITGTITREERDMLVAQDEEALKRYLVDGINGQAIVSRIKDVLDSYSTLNASNRKRMLIRLVPERLLRDLELAYDTNRDTICAAVHGHPDFPSWLAGAGLKVAAIQDKVGGSGKAWQIVLRHGLDNTDAWLSVAEAKVAAIQDKVGGSSNAWTIVISKGIDNVDAWLSRAEAKVKEIQNRVRSPSYAWQIVIRQGVDNVDAWLSRAEAKVVEIEGRVGGNVIAWQIVIGHDIGKVDSWLSRAEAKVAEIQGRVGGLANAWQIVIGRGIDKIDAWLPRAEAKVLAIKGRVGGSAKAWTIVMGQGVDRVDSWVERAGAKVSEIESRVGGPTNAWQIVIGQGIEGVDAWLPWAEAKASEIRQRVGNTSNAWKVVINQGVDRSDEWLSRAEARVAAMQGDVGGPANAWKILTGRGIEKIAAWLPRAKEKVAAIQGRVGGPRNAWAIVIGHDIDGIDAWLPRAEVKVAAIQDRVGGFDKAWQIIMSQGVDKIDTWFPAAEAKVAVIQDRVGGPTNAWQILTRQGIDNVDSWVSRAEAKVLEVQDRTGGSSIAWHIMIEHGIDRVDDWLARAEAKVTAIHGRVGGFTNAWHIIMSHGIDKVDDWLSRAEAKVAVIQDRVGGPSNAWQIIIGHGIDKIDVWLSRAEAKVAAIQDRAGGSANAWAIVIRQGIDKIDAWLPRAEAKVAAMQDKVGGSRNAWMIVIGYGIDNVDAWVERAAPEARLMTEDAGLTLSAAWRELITHSRFDSTVTDQDMAEDNVLPDYTGSGNTSIHAAIADIRTNRAGLPAEALRRQLAELRSDLAAANAAQDIQPLMGKWNARYPSDLEPDLLTEDIPLALGEVEALMRALEPPMTTAAKATLTGSDGVTKAPVGARHAAASTAPGDFSSAIAGLALLSGWDLTYGLAAGKLAKRAIPIYVLLYGLFRDNGIAIGEAEQAANNLARMEEGSLEMLRISGVLTGRERSILAAKDESMLKRYLDEEQNADGLAARIRELIRSYGTLSATNRMVMMRRLVPAGIVDALARLHGTSHKIVFAAMRKHPDFPMWMSRAHEKVVAIQGRVPVAERAWLITLSQGIENTDGWVALAEKKVLSIQGKVGGVSNAWEFIMSHGLEKTDELVALAEKKAQSIQVKVGGFTNAWQIIRCHGLGNVDDWLGRAEEKVLSIKGDVGGFYNAWSIVINQGIEGADAWVGATKPEAQKMIADTGATPASVWRAFIAHQHPTAPSRTHPKKMPAETVPDGSPRSGLSYMPDVYAKAKDVIDHTRFPKEPRTVFIPLSDKFMPVDASLVKGKLAGVWKDLRAELNKKYEFSDVVIVFYDGTLADLNARVESQRLGRPVTRTTAVAYVDADEAARAGAAFSALAGGLTVVREGVAEAGKPAYMSVGGHVILGLGLLDIVRNNRDDSEYTAMVLGLMRALSGRPESYGNMTPDALRKLVEKGELELFLPPLAKADLESIKSRMAMEEALMTSL